MSHMEANLRQSKPVANCRCSQLAETQIQIDHEVVNVHGLLQPVIGGELADLSYDHAATHPRTLLSGCELHVGATAFSRLHAMVAEWKAFQPAAKGVTRQKIDDDKRRIAALTLEVEQAQKQIEEVRQVLVDAHAYNDDLKREVHENRRAKLRASECSLKYCERAKVTGVYGRAGACYLHCKLIDSIAKKNRMKAKAVFEYMARNEIDADVLRRACDRSEPDDKARRARKDYMKRAGEECGR